MTFLVLQVEGAGQHRPPKKRALMVFAPEHADQGLPPVTWGSEVVPEVTDYSLASRPSRPAISLALPP
jgi:hypothetical protein